MTRTMPDAQPDTVVVTGAGRGIGRAVALDAGKTGARVLCISRSERARATKEMIEVAGGRAESLSMDLADYAHAEAATRRWAEQAGSRRYGVVLAAAMLGPLGTLAASDLGRWDETFRVNVLGNLGVLRGLLDRMLQEAFGRIVFLAGGGAAYAYPLFPAYACTKAALVRAVEDLQDDLRDKGDFSVVILAPGAVDTDLLQQVRAAGAEVRTKTEVDETIRFIRAFFSGEASALSGRFIHVRDQWQDVLDGAPILADRWKLRRVD